jgi:hypothetical protein
MLGFADGCCPVNPSFISQKRLVVLNHYLLFIAKLGLYPHFKGPFLLSGQKRN